MKYEISYTNAYSGVEFPAWLAHNQPLRRRGPNRIRGALKFASSNRKV